MKKVKTIRCTSCGSAEVETIGNGIGKCVHCQSTMLLPRQDEEIIALLNTAHVYRENFNYDLAIKSYQYVLEKDPQELSAYEGILLSEYGIEYVKDTYSNKLVPTCHRAHFKSILEDSNYQALMSLADEQQKQVIEKKALEIDKLQKAIERQLQNEESYDVFISYKANDKNGEKTEDSLIARNIYEELTNKNYKVFFSEKSLEDRLGSEYEPVIFKALHTAKIFILVGTSKENIEATWVRNEWSRFIDRIKNEPQTLNGNNFIPVFKDMNPYDFPKVNNNFVQGVDATKLGYSIAVLDGVQRILKPEKEKKVLDTFDNVDNIEQFEKIRKQRKKELKRKNWNELLTDPKKKKQKILHFLFMASPIITGLLTLFMCLFEATFFCTHICFYLLCLFFVSTITLSIVVTCIQTKRYGLKPLLNIVIPFVTVALTIIIFLCTILTPSILLNGMGQQYAYLGYSYSNGFIFKNNGDSINIEASTARIEKTTEKVNGQTHLVIQHIFKSKKINYLSLSIPDSVEVLVLPETSPYNRSYIYISKNSKLKEIYYDGDGQNNYNYSGIPVGISYWNNNYYENVKENQNIVLYCKTWNPQGTIYNDYFSSIEQKTYPYL